MLKKPLRLKTEALENGRHIFADGSTFSFSHRPTCPVNQIQIVLLWGGSIFFNTASFLSLG